MGELLNSGLEDAGDEYHNCWFLIEEFILQAVYDSMHEKNYCGGGGLLFTKGHGKLRLSRQNYDKNDEFDENEKNDEHFYVP